MKYLLLILLLLPSVTLAYASGSIRDRANQRGLIRIGRTVRTRQVSPRRVRRSVQGTVTRVVDGSVLVVRLDSGETVTVRTLGSEAPLLLTGSLKDQCFAGEAKMILSRMILGKTVELEKDRYVRKDNSGRLLQYVRVNTLDIGGWMVGNGYTFYDANNTYQRKSAYRERQEGAVENERGLWGHFCEYNNNLDTIEILQ